MAMRRGKDGDFRIEDALQQIVEAAYENEETITRSAASLHATAQILQEQTNLLPTLVAQKIKENAAATAAAAAQQFTATLTAATSAAEKARITYDAAVRFSFWRIFTSMLLSSFAGLAAMVVKIWLIIPDVGKMQTLREEEAKLQSNIKALAEQGGRVYLQNCKTESGPTRLCVRTDETWRDTVFTNQDGTFRLVK